MSCGIAFVALCCIEPTEFPALSFVTVIVLPPRPLPPPPPRPCMFHFVFSHLIDVAFARPTRASLRVGGFDHRYYRRREGLGKNRQ